MPLFGGWSRCSRIGSSRIALLVGRGTVSLGSGAMISEYDFDAVPKRFYRIRASANPDNL